METAKNIKLKATILFIVDIVFNAAIIIAMVLVIRTKLIAPFQIYGPSMCDTFNKYEDDCEKGYGEYIIINKAGYQNFFGWQVGSPQRGDVVIFHPPQSKEDFYIKRVIGVAGDTVEIKSGYIYITNEQHPDGFKLDEPYLNSENLGNTQPLIAGIKQFTVPEGEYFVMGDNRKHSSDSRSCFQDPGIKNCSGTSPSAFIKPSMIEGKAWLVLWPFNHLRIVPNMDYGI